MRAVDSGIQRMKRMVGGEMLGRSYYAFLLVHTSFLICVKLPGVFINTLLLGESSDVNVVMLYNLVFFLAGAVSMVVAAQVLHRTNPGIVAVIGVVGYNILYLMLIVLILTGQVVSHYYIVLAVLTGVADGFYWLSYGNLLSETTETETRDSAIAIISIAMSFVNLTAPLFAGWIITVVGNISGYLVVFAMAFAVSIVTSLLAFRLPKSRAPMSDRVDYGLTMRLTWRNKSLRYSILAQGNKGIREGVFTFILSVILYQIISSELLIGVNTFVAALVSILSFTIMSRILSPGNRVGFMLVATAILSAAAVVCLFRLDVMMIFVFTVLNSFFAGFIENSSYSIFLDRLQIVPELRSRQPEIFAINECALVTGRAIGIAIVLLMGFWFGSSLTVQVVSIVILSVTQFLTVLFCKLSENTTEHESEVME